ncbi:hypothetical protein C8F01DRAFT_971488 [Mycena amicta]|nr:hypothetical protein C8F01DRAFT_971488 [Mycena amicta]
MLSQLVASRFSFSKRYLFHLRKYSTETPLQLRLLVNEDLSSDLVGQLNLPNGLVTSRHFARWPTSPTEAETPTTVSFLWKETHEALTSAGFQPTALPSPSLTGLYTAGPSTVAGTGMFATRDIPRGHTLLVERPFLLSALQQPVGAPESAEAMRTWPLSSIGVMIRHLTKVLVEKRFTEQERTTLFGLSGSSLHDIMARNSIVIRLPMPGAYTGYHTALCREASLINHSCKPNADLAWDPDSFSLSLHALFPISKGQEITRPYINEIQPRAARQELLESQYSFVCKCPSCALPDDASAKSDEARRLIFEEYEQIFVVGEQSLTRWLVDSESDKSMPDDYFVASSERMLQLMDEERCGVPEHRAQHYMRLLATSAALCDVQGTRKWAKKMIELGNPALRPLLDIGTAAFASPQSLPVWGCRNSKK